jgi:hypothetical protein
MPNTKSYNNPEDWEKIEGKQKPTIVSNEIQYNTNQENNTEASEDSDIIEAENADDFFKNDEKENFDEVLQLTQYNDSLLKPNNNVDFVIAEYTDIKTAELLKKHETIAKTFVAKITKFILEFNDVTLTEEHKKYLKQVGGLQVQHLSDLLYLVDVNKLMLNNIIARVNATQAEDYAIINTYNNLANQHLKLIKEVQNTYKSIPTTIKKMKADILCNQELEVSTDTDEEIITKEYGESQFNNTKNLMKVLLKDRETADKNKTA